MKHLFCEKGKKFIINSLTQKRKKYLIYILSLSLGLIIDVHTYEKDLCIVLLLLSNIILHD